MKKINIIMAIIALLLFTLKSFAQISSQYQVAATLYREYAAKTKCPELARYLIKMAKWNDCMVDVLASRKTGCSLAPSGDAPTCPQDSPSAGNAPSSKVGAISGSTYPGTTAVDPAAVEATVRSMAELLELTKRSPEKIEADRQRRAERLSRQQDEESKQYSKRDFALSIEAGIYDQQLSAFGYHKFYLSEGQLPLAKVYPSFGLNYELRLMQGSRGGFFHTGIKYVNIANSVLIAKEPPGKAFVRSKTDSIGGLKLSYLRVPAFLSYRLFRFLGEDGVYLQFGFNGDYLIGASTNPVKTAYQVSGSNHPSVTNKKGYNNSFSKFSASGMAGVRFDLWRLYVQAQVDVPLVYHEVMLTSNYREQSSSTDFNSFKYKIGVNISSGIYLWK